MASIVNNTLSTNGSSSSSSSNTSSAGGGFGANDALSRLSGSGDKLRKLQITKKESTSFLNREPSSSKLNGSPSSSSNTNGSISNSNVAPNGGSTVKTPTWDSNFDEIVVTIKKSERGFGFELRNGILIVAVYPNTPASNSGIQVGDIILKVNGTCVRTKEQNEILNLIHESNSFVSLTLQRKISQLTNNKQPSSPEADQQQALKNVTNQLNNSQMNSDAMVVNNDTGSIDIDYEYFENNENTATSTIAAGSQTTTASTTTAPVDAESGDMNINNEIAGSAVNSADISSKLSEYINSNLPHIENSTNNHLLMANDETAHLMDTHRTDNMASNKRSIKSSRNTTGSKTLQTQSLSNIIVPSLTHSASDNDLENRQIDVDDDDQELLDLCYNSDDNLEAHDGLNDKSLFDMSGYNDYNQLVTRPINVSVLLIYILCNVDENPRYLYFSMFVDDLLSANEKKETLLRWAFELYTTFLRKNSPLELDKVSEATCARLETLFDRNAQDNLSLMKKLFEEVKLEAVEVVNKQIAKFREVKQLGLANMFQANEILKLTQMNKSDADTMKCAVADALGFYTNGVARDLQRISQDWNGPNESTQSALICSFATFVKRYSLPIRKFGQVEMEKVPTFVNKKPKLKKSSSSSSRGHSFIDCSFFNPKLVCAKCQHPFWGIGYQGVICQKTKCELKLHRSCYAQSVPIECVGMQKTIRTDYIQKLFFGGKKKEEEAAEGAKGVYTQSMESSFTNGDIITNLPGDYEQRNLPVELAIKRFESLNARKVSPPLASPANGSPNGTTNLIRNNTIGTTTTQSSKGEQIYSNQTNHTLATTKQQAVVADNSATHGSGSGGEIAKKAVSSKEQACKRVGSLKVDAKKVKSNVARSKSDPEPEEIRFAISNRTDRFSTESIDPNDSLVNQTTSSANTSSNYSSISSANATLTNSYRSSPAPSTITAQSLLSTTTTTATLHPSASTSSSNNSSSRQSWMNGSDMEVDDELPQLNSSIDKTQMSKRDIKTQEVINELIHTEQKHVRNLKIMQHHFCVPIKVNFYLSEEELKILFPNLEEVLEIHSKFNNKLKKLRKENSIVPVDQLVDIILEQFKGEQGEKFQMACAKFCENQGQAMKLLQTKLKNSEKFSQFLASAESHSICRKLQLKDFIPTEVQRLVKYKLLFHELTKNVTDENQRERLMECVDASSKISLYVNQAVTECENQKRAEEIQSRMDTKEFDQYCVKSPIMAQYKNLDLKSRKLIYEGELEWKINVNVKLLALLFQDILVLLERANDENKRRYILKPLSFILNKSRQTFTPVIPLQCINSFRPMHEKRNFHLVAIIDDFHHQMALRTMSSSSSLMSGLASTSRGSSSNAKQTLHTQVSSSGLQHQQQSNASLGSQSSTPSSKSIQTQMLFIFTAKSGDERNKWTHYLQELTGKMTETDKNAIDLTAVNTLTPNHSIDAKSISSNSTVSSDSKLSTRIAPINVNLNESIISSATSMISHNESITGSSGVTNKANADNEKISNFEYLQLEAQLKENTNGLNELLKSREIILAKMLKFNVHLVESESTTEFMNTSSSTNNSSQSTDSLLDNSIGILNSLTQSLITSNLVGPPPKTPTTPGGSVSSSSQSPQSFKIIKNLLELETNLNRLRKNYLQQQLPNLKLSTPINQTAADIRSSTISQPSLSPNSQQHTQGPSSRLLINRPLRYCQTVENPELISTSSIISTASSNGDLSEDEQINYYDDNMDIVKSNSSNDDDAFQVPEEAVTVTLMTNKSSSVTNPTHSVLRNSSTSSDQTIIMSNEKKASPHHNHHHHHHQQHFFPTQMDLVNDLSDDEVKEYNVFKEGDESDVELDDEDQVIEAIGSTNA